MLEQPDLVSPLGWCYYLWLPAGGFFAWISAGGRPCRWADTSGWLLAIVVVGLWWPNELTVLGQPGAWASATIGSIYFWGTAALWLFISGWRTSIERAVPHGRTAGGRDKGAWRDPPANASKAWKQLAPGFARLTEKTPRLEKTNNRLHLGTLGGGNHFIELCLDESAFLWIMLHSGSRGVGNAIGSHFVELAKRDMHAALGDLPDQDLAYFSEGTRHFADYVEANGPEAVVAALALVQVALTAGAVALGLALWRGIPPR